MKLASLSPLGVTLSQPETEKPQNLRGDTTAVPSTEESPNDTDSAQKEKGKFARIFDLIQAAQKRAKDKNHQKSKKQNTRALRTYQRQKEFKKYDEMLVATFRQEG